MHVGNEDFFCHFFPKKQCDNKDRRYEVIEERRTGTMMIRAKSQITRSPPKNKVFYIFIIISN